jgi:hypothetical protein
MRTRRADYERCGMEDYFHSVTDDGEFVDLEAEEANYGYATELERWTKQGAVFVGHHGAGGSYPGHYFAAAAHPDGASTCAEISECDGSVVVEVDIVTGEPTPGSVQFAREFALVNRAACAVLRVCPCCHMPPGQCYRKKSQTTPEPAAAAEKGGEHDGR